MADFKGKTATGVVGAILGVVATLAGGGTLEDIMARVAGEEPLKTVALRLAKNLCAMPEAERIGEWSSFNDTLAEEDKSWAMPACDAEEQVTGPADAEEVEEAAAAVEKEAEAQAVEDTEAIEAEVAEVVEEEAAEAEAAEADHTDEIDPLKTVVDEAADTVKEATQ